MESFLFHLSSVCCKTSCFSCTLADWPEISMHYSSIAASRSYSAFFIVQPIPWWFKHAGLKRFIPTRFFTYATLNFYFGGKMQFGKDRSFKFPPGSVPGWNILQTSRICGANTSFMIDPWVSSKFCMIFTVIYSQLFPKRSVHLGYNVLFLWTPASENKTL